jgi:hypothetical protein
MARLRRPHRLSLAIVAVILASVSGVTVAPRGGLISANAATPVLRSVSTNATNSTNFTAAAPAGETAGDTLIAALQINGTGTVAPPAGWALIGSTNYGGDVTYSYSKIAGCFEPTSYTWTSTGYSNGSISILDYSGLNSPTPVNAWAGGMGYGSSGVAPAVTTTATTVPLILVTFDGAPASLSPTDPTGWTRRWFQHSYEWTYGADNLSPAAAGSLPAVTVATGTNDIYTAQQIALTIGTQPSPVCPAFPTVTVSSTQTGNSCNFQYGTNDPYNTTLYGITAPAGEPSPTQRLLDLNPPFVRVNSNTDGGEAALTLPFPAPYTSADSHSIPAWDFTHQVNALGAAPQSMEHLLDISSPPDVMFTGSGKLGPVGAPPSSGTLGLGTLADLSYRDLASYMANLVRYYNTGILATGSGATVSFGATSLTDTSQSLSAYGNGTYSVTVNSVTPDGRVTWQTAAITSVTGASTVNVSAWPKGTPAAGSAYNLASTVPPITSPVNATPWPRPPHVGPVRDWEIMNEPDLSNSFYPRTSPTVTPPSPTLTGVTVAGGTLVPGTTYAYRITAMSIAGAESLPGPEIQVTLGSGQNAVQVGWTATTNIGLSPYAYGIYGRRAGGELAMVVVGRDAPSGLTWTDSGGVTPAGGFSTSGLPTADSTVGYQLFRAHEYRKMWDVVVPAMKAVDPSIKVVGPTIGGPTSLAQTDVITTAVTSGPGDRSYLSSADFVPVLMSNPVNPPDVVSVHGYGGSGGTSDSDALMLTGAGVGLGIDGLISRYRGGVQPYVGNTPVWQTEANDQAAWFNSTDFRGVTQFDSAWLSSFFARMCTGIPQVRASFQYEWANGNTWSLIGSFAPPSTCPPQPACTSIASGRPLLPYWTLYYLTRLIPPGSKLLSVSDIPTGLDLIAVATPPAYTKIEVLVVNRLVGSTAGLGTATTLGVALGSVTSKATQEWLVDQNTDLVKGPSAQQLGAVSNVTLNMNGYAVAIVEFAP